ncbi:exported hypothetical protein [uncultured Defluviicoccus sp.]|uniref:F5/8 type C domain-containing protein n=1 Tax=metagenome TaxID=256318 RepID=A0A380TDM7_9ZZZZ|nr:exported hypothetical protein [uncultured Defluviicoccus sp.]
MNFRPLLFTVLAVTGSAAAHEAARLHSLERQDTAWRDTPEASRHHRVDHISLPVMQRLRGDPESHFFLGCVQHLTDFLEAHPEVRDEVIRYMKEERLECGATFNEPCSSWLSGEELVREIYFGRRWIRQNLSDCDAQVAVGSVAPGLPSQMPQILAKAGIPYLTIGGQPEGFHRWFSPDGTGVLAYSFGGTGNLNAMIRPVAAGGGDLPVPVGQPSSFRAFFEAGDRSGPPHDRITGERPDPWVYLTDPTHHEMSSLRREAARLLPAAETFTTMACLLQGGFRDWPAREFAGAWLDELSPDHGLGGKNGHITDEVYRRRVERARDVGRVLLDRALTAIAAKVKVNLTRGLPIVVFNDLSWSRSDVVELPLPGFATPARVVDAEGHEIPTQFTALGAPDEVNVAAASVGATASSSSVSGAPHHAAMTIDGTWNNRAPDPVLGVSDKWKSGKGPEPQWVMVDFGQSRTVHKVVVYHEGVFGAFGVETSLNTADFQIQRADAATGPWTDLVPPVVSNRASVTTHRFEPQTFRFLRLYITGRTQPDGDEFARIAEIQAFASAPPKQRRLVFVAADVPPLGYKTYYLTDPRIGKSGIAPAQPPATTTECENQFYRLELTPGGIKALFDKEQGRDLLDTGKFLGGEVFSLLSVAPDNRAQGTDAGEFDRIPLPAVDESFDQVARHRPVWTLLENGPVRTAYQLEQSLSGALVRQRVLLWHGLKRVDCEVDLAGFDGRLWREFRMALPLAMAEPKLAYEEPMGVVEIGRDEIPTRDSRVLHPRQIQNFVDASDAHGGLTMSSSVSVFDWIDPTADPRSRQPLLQPVLLASRKSFHAEGCSYPQTGDHRYRFSLTSHAGGWRNGWRAGVAANHPLIPILAQTPAGASLPVSMSFAAVGADNIVVSTIKKCEDDDTVIVRLHDIEGRDARAVIKLFQPVATATRTNLIEEGGQPLTVEQGQAVIEVGHHAIETIKLTPRVQ